MTSRSERLHITAIIFFAFKSLKEMIIYLISMIFIFSNLPLPYLLLGVTILIGLIIALGWLKWFRFTYAINGDGIKIEHGIFIRKKRTISKYRIQSINFNQNIVHRLLGLTGVQIETAGSDQKIDANLISLKMSDAERLRVYLKTTTEEVAHTEEYNYDYALEKQLPKYEASYKRLFAFGSTSGGFGVIAAIILFIFSEAEAFIPEQIFDQTTAWLLAQAIGTLIIFSILVLGVIWLISVIGSVIKYGDFTIVRYENELYITRGLWEKKQLTIPLGRIQSVGIKQNGLRLPFKLGSLFVEIAGGEVDDKENFRTIIFPLIRRSEMALFLNKILPEYQYTLEELKPISKRFLSLHSVIQLIILAVVTSLILAFIPTYWWISILLLFILNTYLVLYYKMTKTDLNQSQLTLQYLLLFSRETVFLKKDRIQALEYQQNLLQRRLEIAKIKASILNNFVGQHYIVKGLPIKEVERIIDWYSYRDVYTAKQLGLDQQL